MNVSDITGATAAAQEAQRTTAVLAKSLRLAREHAAATVALIQQAAPGEAMPLRISVGAAVYPADGRAFDALLAVADRRMYHDKTMTRRGAARWTELAETSSREAARTILRD